MGRNSSSRVTNGRDYGLTGDSCSSRQISQRMPSLVERRPFGGLSKGVIIVLALMLSFAALAVCFRAPAKNAGPLPASSQSMVLVPVSLINQYKDTNMQCFPDGPLCPAGIHLWNHVKGVDGVYGSVDDCPHCSCYCAPASIAMIAKYRGLVGVNIQQDNIYDNGKSVGELGVGDNLLSTHGIGMFDGSGGLATEVQASFMWSIGPFTQHDSVPANPNGPLTAAKLVQYLAFGHPVLWLDHGGFPKNQSPSYPPPTDRQFEGHAKVIAGYDDSDTLGDTKDDLCLIYDPWPEYLDLSILPTNATLGPGNSFDPYWLPLNDVNLSDPADIYLVDKYPDITEFGSVLVPVVGMALIAVVCFGIKPRKQRE